MSETTDETELLSLVLGDDDVAHVLAEAPAGWRDLSEHELVKLGLGEHWQRRVSALQDLTKRSYPELPDKRFLSSSDVARVYRARLAGALTESMIAVAVNGRNQLIAELPIAHGGRHGISIYPADILRPAIRCGAASLLLVHNHPSGDPTPSEDDLEMTRALAAIAEACGVPLLDHVIVARDGCTSLSDLGLIPTHGEEP